MEAKKESDSVGGMDGREGAERRRQRGKTTGNLEIICSQAMDAIDAMGVAELRRLTEAQREEVLSLKSLYLLGRRRRVVVFSKSRFSD